MKNVFITGISGYIGWKIAEALSLEKSVQLIAGCDIRKPDRDIDGVAFYARDVREPIDDILMRHSIDTVVHCAFVLPPIHDVRLMEDINVNGTRNVIDCCMKHCVNHLLYTSSATAYGFHPDNDRPLTEDSPLRGNDSFTYSCTKKQIEKMIAEKMQEKPRMKLTVLRPSFVVGPGFTNPLARYLQKKIVPLPRRTEALQFVHEDDLIDIMMMVLRRGIGGCFNVGAEGVVSFKEMVGMLGGFMIPVPGALLSPLNNLAWNLRLSSITEFPSAALDMAMYPWVVSSEKLTRETGYRYRYNTMEAFKKFAAHVKGGEN